MQTVSSRQVETGNERIEEPLPPRVREALGQLVGAAKEGLLALSVGVGLGSPAGSSRRVQDEPVSVLLERIRAERSTFVLAFRVPHQPGRVADGATPQTPAAGRSRLSGSRPLGRSR